jgi:RNA polymerase sigma-70 factor (ECF subfamily)
MSIVISQPTRIASERRSQIDIDTEPAHAAANPVNTPLQPNDAQLLQRVAARDRQAFAQLYDRYSTLLFSTVLRVLNNREESAEVLQEVFLQMWDKAGDYNPLLGKPFTWLLTIARHKAIDRLRALRRRYTFIEEVTQEAQATSRPAPPEPGEAFSHEQAVLIRCAVAELPLEQRQAIEMAFLGGLTQHEIADALQQPLGTIKARIRRGMLKLRDSLKPIL